MRERQHELEASRLALRQPADPPLRPDAEGASEVVGVGVVPRRIEGRRVLEQAGARHRPVRGILALGHVADLRPHLGPLAPGIQPEDLRGAGVGALQVHEHLEQGALAGAVDPDEDVHRPVGHPQVHAARARTRGRTAWTARGWPPRTRRLVRRCGSRGSFLLARSRGGGRRGALPSSSAATSQIIVTSSSTPSPLRRASTSARSATPRTRARRSRRSG